MKIKSNFEDYYDSIQTFFPYPKIEYNRVTHSVSPKQLYFLKTCIRLDNLNTIKQFTCKDKSWCISFFVIGFCKKLYQGVLIAFPDSFEVSYTLTGVNYLPSKYGLQVPIEVQNHAKIHFPFWENYNSDIFDEIDAPSFVIFPANYHNISVIKNPNLSSFHFYKNVDSWDAFYKIKNHLIVEQKKKKTTIPVHFNFDYLYNLNSFIASFFSIK